MPSLVAHALAGLTLASALAPSRAWRRLAILAAVAAMLPDVDAVTRLTGSHDVAFALPAGAVQTREANDLVSTAEGYDYEKHPADAARSRRAYLDAISAARRARSPLIRAAAVELARRDSCF
jgi:hypothetical protein